MAKPIMLSEIAYKELTALKKLKEKSYSETIMELLDDEKIRKGKDLKRLLGISKDKKGWDRHLKEMRGDWKKWSERYA